MKPVFVSWYCVESCLHFMTSQMLGRDLYSIQMYYIILIKSPFLYFFFLVKFIINIPDFT